MPFPDLSVCREYAAERINAIVNHPDVRPWVGYAELGPIDLTQTIANPDNIFLMAEGGGFICVFQEPGIWEVHSQFLPEHRGENALKSAQDGMRYMFTRTPCVELRTKVPEGNVAAAALARKMGFVHQFTREGVWPTPDGMKSVRYFAITIDQWAGQCAALEASGEFFHDKLEAAKAEKGATIPLHAHDSAHDRYVGATVEMIAFGFIDKAMAFYRRWAAFAGYGPIYAIAANPLVIDIGDALLAVRGDDFEVLLVR